MGKEAPVYLNTGGNLPLDLEIKKKKQHRFWYGATLA